MGLIYNEDQRAALKLLAGGENVFLTGQAGVGKTTVVKEFLSHVDRRTFPVLASTGMAALLLGGRTVHSAFGIGVASGTEDQVISKALQNQGVFRLGFWKGFLIDEISMIDAKTLNIIEKLSRRVRGNQKPWGGLRVVAVGDFAQLPPVSEDLQKPWAFKAESWERTGFKNVMLKQVMRTNEPQFISVLNYVRRGVVNGEVKDFLDARVIKDDSKFVGTRLFGRKKDVHKFNMEKLREISGPELNFRTRFWVKHKEDYHKFVRDCPIGEELIVKDGALVMIRVNDPDGNYVNGSLGFYRGFEQKGGIRGNDAIKIELMSNGMIVHVSEYTFEKRNGNDDVIASAKNFPVTLAYAMTIHKTQGATLDNVLIDANDFWEAGQCYVALSRVRTTEGLNITNWNSKSIIADQEVIKFYNSFQQRTKYEQEKSLHY